MAVQLGKGMSEVLRGASERDDGQASSRGAGAVLVPSGPPQESLVGTVAEIINYWHSDRSLAKGEVQRSLDQYRWSISR